MVTTRAASLFAIATLVTLGGCTANTGMRRMPRGEDPEASGLRIESPVADAWIGSSSVMVSGIATDVTEVTVNGVPATLADGRFTAMVPVAEGRQTIEAVAVAEGRRDDGHVAPERGDIP